MRAWLSRRRGPVIVVVAVSLYALQQLAYADYVTDDSFIYAHFAENLARSGELAFNAGHAVHGVTSPLWVALGAVGRLGGLDAMLALRVLGWLAGATTVALGARWATRRLPAGRWPLLASLLLATEPWLVRWAGSGMETPLAALLLLVILEAGLRRREEVAWAPLGWAVGVAPLVRPEMALLWGLVLARSLLDDRARRSLGLWLGLLLPLLLWTAWALPHVGRIWPETVRAKSTPLGLQPARLVANVKVLVEIAGVGAGVTALAAAASVLWRRAWRERRQAEGWLSGVVWGWLLLLPAIYLLRDVQVVSRYLEVLLPAVVLLGTWAAARSPRRRLLAGAWAAQGVLALCLTLVWIAPNARAFSRSLQAGLGDIAGWLRENTAEDDVVAAYDIGLLGFRSQRPLLDLGGLIEPGINALRDRVDDEEILRRGLFLRFGQPRYLVHRAADADALAGLVLDGVAPVPLLHRQVANLGLTRRHPVVYTLYRLETLPR